VFSYANLSGADLTDVDLSNTRLVGADLSGAKLTRADLTSVVAHGGDYSWSDLSGANLTGANFSKTTLNEAELIGADLTNANFQDAHMLNVNLSNTILHGADFTGSVNLDTVNLTAAKIAGVTPIDRFIGPIVCNGQGVSEMPAYNTHVKGIRPIVIKFSLGSLGIPKSWKPDSDNPPVLVACIVQEAITIDVCQYTYPGGDAAPPITRKRIDMEVILRSADSGQVLARQVFQGGQPDSCPAQTYPGNTVIQGQSPESTIIVEWLKAFVETP